MSVIAERSVVGSPLPSRKEKPCSMKVSFFLVAGSVGVLGEIIVIVMGTQLFSSLLFFGLESGSNVR